MKKRKYVIRLNEDERNWLTELIKKRGTASYKRKRAQALLKADVGEMGPGWGDQDIADSFDICRRTVETLRKKAVEEGLEKSLERAEADRSATRKLDGEKEARLVQLACSEPPDGYNRWTLQLLADTMVELELVDSLSYETVRRTLKKTS